MTAKPAQRAATELLARDQVRQCAAMLRVLAEMVEGHAMTASAAALEGSLKTMRAAMNEAVTAYKGMAAATEGEGQ